jgi:hypothetical protein
MKQFPAGRYVVDFVAEPQWMETKESFSITWPIQRVHYELIAYLFNLQPLEFGPVTEGYEVWLDWMAIQRFVEVLNVFQGRDGDRELRIPTYIDMSIYWGVIGGEGFSNRVVSIRDRASEKRVTPVKLIESEWMRPGGLANGLVIVDGAEELVQDPGEIIELLNEGVDVRATDLSAANARKIGSERELVLGRCIGQESEWVPWLLMKGSRKPRTMTRFRLVYPD